MSLTALQLITYALTDLGEVGQGEQLAPEDSAQGIDYLNNLLASLSDDRLNQHQITTYSGTLSATVGSYTFGPSGTLSVPTRPVIIQTAQIVIGGLGRDLEIISAPAWNALMEQALTGILPLKLWPNATYPNLTLNFWPRPSGTPTVILNYWGLLAGAALVLSDTILLPDDYLRALRIILAVDMAPSYGRQPSEALMGSYKDSYALLRSRNLLDATIANLPQVSPTRGDPQAQG